MMRWMLFLLLLGGLLSHHGDTSGREGNALYDRGQFAEAEAAYQEGLTHVDPTDSTRYAALMHNKGAAQYQQDNYEAAAEAFAEAQAHAVSEDEQIRIRYNAATNAARAGRLEDALSGYRDVLLRDPTHDDARHNYEVIARQQSAPQTGPPPPDIEPSAYAERVHRRARALAAQRQYREALTLMQEGLAQDSTVAAYQDFMGRLDTIARIDDGDDATLVPQ